MATDWAADVKKYVAEADDAAIAGIVRYCGIALRNRDSSLVAFSDKTETDRVRNNFLKKKLGLTQADSTLDKAIAKVGEVMKADRTKNRVTVYYLLAAEFKKLGLFIKKETAKAPAKAPAAKAAPKSAAKAAGAAAVLAGAAAATKAASKKTAAPKKAAAAKPAAKASAAKKVAAPKKSAPAKLVNKVADTGKSGTAAVAGTVAAVGAVGAAAVAAASGAADTVKDTASKAVGAAGDAAGAAAGAVTGAAGAAAGAVTGAAGAAAGKAGALFSGGGQAASSDDEGANLGWLAWVFGIGLILFALWWTFGRGGNDADVAASVTPTEAASGADAGAAASGAAVDLASAPAEGSVAIPAGAGVTSETRDGKPVVKVYFASGKVDVAPAFGPAGAGLKSWLDAHPGAKLAVTGYADPSGNAAFNADLSKRRAEAVQAELGKAGIGPDVAQLVKPSSSTDAQVPKSAARRVEVTVQ
jgi:outer membrane protein OmpA-like peptidoglycan-associated protein